MGFIVLLAAIIAVRITWRLMSRRSKPRRFDGSWSSDSYRRKIAATSSDYKSRL